MESSSCSNNNPCVPNEIWLKIIQVLDLDHQNVMAEVGCTMERLVVSEWCTRLKVLVPQLDSMGGHFLESNAKVVMRERLSEIRFGLKPTERRELFQVLFKYTYPERFLLCKDNIDIQADVAIVWGNNTQRFRGLKSLGFGCKWPCPRSSDLERFCARNDKLISLYVADCRNNIQATNALLTHCKAIQVLKLEATDSLLPYTEILELRSLRFLEVQLDLYYPDVRDNLLLHLHTLPHLQVLKIPLCYGMRDRHVLFLLQNCPSLKILHLPFNGKISGWFLDDFLHNYLSDDSSNNNNSVQTNNLQEIKVFLNSGYISPQEIVSRDIEDSARQRLAQNGTKLVIARVNWKLESFNQRGFRIEQFEEKT